MSESDIDQIKDRLARLETKVEEKWDSHDKRADERWTDLMENIHELKNRPCKDHAELMVEFNQRVKVVERWQAAANWAIGVVYVALIGVLIKEILH